MNQSLHLFQLQQIDTENDQINLQIEEINKRLTNDERLHQAEARLREARQSLLLAQQALKQIESNVQSVRLKIETSESSLYSGKIRNPKELQDLQSEIASLKRRLSTLEDEQLEAMLTLEQAEQMMTVAQEDFSQAQLDHNQIQSKLLEEKKHLLSRIKSLSEQRKAILGSISVNNLATYEQLRQRKRGVAVAKVEENACKACGATIRPAELQNIRTSSALVFCSSCGRVLFAG